jgi:PAS domain S-box-containing protein
MLKSLIAVLDFTKRKRAVDELRKNELRLEEAQRIAHFGWWERDFSTNGVFLSDALCRIFGIQPADIPEWHQRWLKLIHPEDRSRVAEAAAAALRRGPRYDVEYRVVRPDGAERVVHSRGDVTWDHAGKPLRQFGVLQDITELRRVERELRASEARFRTFVDHAMDAFFLLDDRLTVIDVNRQACDSLGYSRNELIGMHPRNFDVGLDEESIERLRQRIAAGETLTFETRHRRKDGTSFPVEIRSGQFEPGGRLLCLVRDISERKRAEDALRASEERFRTLVQFSFDAYWESDAQHRFIRQEFANGLADAPAPGSEVGKTRWEVPYLEPDEEAWCRHRETLDAHIPFRDFELARPAPDGGKRYVSVSGMPVFDDKGRFVGYRGVGRHITERKRAEVAIRESEQRFRTLFEKATDAIFLENVRDEIIEVNERACALLGYSREELLKMKVSDLQAPEMRAQAGMVVRGDLERHGDATRIADLDRLSDAKCRTSFSTRFASIHIVSTSATM